MSKIWPGQIQTYAQNNGFQLSFKYDLDLSAENPSIICNTSPHNKEHLRKVIIINLYACRSNTPDRDFQLIPKCELDL